MSEVKLIKMLETNQLIGPVFSKSPLRKDDTSFGYSAKRRHTDMSV